MPAITDYFGKSKATSPEEPKLIPIIPLESSELCHQDTTTRNKQSSSSPQSFFVQYI